jgi:murein L,D-transpeptidase YafK
MQLLKNFLTFILTLAMVSTIYAQDDTQKFRSFQLSCSRVSQACAHCDDTLRSYFEKRGISYPPKDIFLRAFKSQNEMELWARNDENMEYKLIKTYHICALSGILGPKRWEGDRQVPEGFYFIDEFNPKSEYYLSLLINYPNYSDSVMGGDMKLGGNIYIHGGCVTIGCMPMTDEVIQELYVVCFNAKLNGENYIPVHIFPTRFTRPGMNFLNREYGRDVEKTKFWATLKESYDYFEKYHKLLPVMYSPDGKYAN